MLFSSLVFICVFLPALLFLYFCAPRSWRNNLLLAASLIFYAWGEMKLVWVIVASVVWNHCAALAIDRAGDSAKRKILLALAVTADLAVLGYFKYVNFFIANWNVLSGMSLSPRQVVLPIGISFYTFQAISYLADVYRRDTPVEKNLLNTGLYITFFPQLIAGPIVKFHEISGFIRCRRESSEEFSAGMQRFIEGLAKKILIANVMAEVADQVFACDPRVLAPQEAWLGAIAYTMQIFFDFSGYSDMAIGLGHMFGFTIPENFDYPYAAVTITEFWRKWHISLSSWFREYLYIPLGGSREGSGKTLRNLMIVFLITGLWHGAGWTFILWGVWHGVLVLAERLCGLNKRQIPQPWKILLHVYALLAVTVGWVLFRSETLTQALAMTKKMFSIAGWRTGETMSVSRLFTAMLIAAIFFSTPLPRIVYAWIKRSAVGLFCWRICCCGLLFLVLLRLAGASYNPFIYFRF